MPFKLMNTSCENDGSRKRKLAAEHRLQKLKVRHGMQGRVDICVYKVSDEAGNIWCRFEGISAALWQVRFIAIVFVCNT